MRKNLLCACMGFISLLPLFPARGQAAKAAPQQPAATRAKPVEVDDGLFLSPDDIPRVRRMLPGLVDASHKGLDGSQKFLAKQKVNFQQLTQQLSNISVAYSAIVFDEWMKELQPQMAADPGQYQQLIEQARRQIDEITAKHQRAQKSGRSALAVNKELVAKNRGEVEAIINLLRDVTAKSLPLDPATDSPPVR